MAGKKKSPREAELEAKVAELEAKLAAVRSRRDEDEVRLALGAVVASLAPFVGERPANRSDLVAGWQRAKAIGDRSLPLKPHEAALLEACRKFMANEIVEGTG